MALLGHMLTVTTPFAFQTGRNDQGAPGSRSGWGPDSPEVQGTCVCFFQVKINSRGLVYSVVLLLGSVALTVSFSNPKTEASRTLHFIRFCPVTYVSLKAPYASPWQ